MLTLDEYRVRIAAAMGLDVSDLTGPSPDGLPDHWADAAPISAAGPRDEQDR